ncbi:hypothetical protein SAMN05421780_101309 [Flexibacter flexilis DSM 6793]|uniref:Uncharacterized protein n=1 Tax=Flexibacter flexilis DSM 6793 TaxID=927664 RepID=A0A1I1DMW6_9BACT|nr:hypothetical protein SAMN05421780_101309 [Flexibacter flexilis DSM 6793]
MTKSKAITVLILSFIMTVVQRKFMFEEPLSTNLLKSAIFSCGLVIIFIVFVKSRGKYKH